jgi:predicted enzyme related to lactoylglutathione lyase
MRNAMFWVEIPAENFERAQKFYETIFDAQVTSVPFPRGKYGLFPLDQEAKGGGGAIVEGPGYEPSDAKGALVYLDRGDQDLNVPLSKVEAAGGKILLPKTDNAGFGFVAQFIDTEGNRMGLHSFN